VAKFIEMDEQITFAKQKEEDADGQVILINKFTVNPEDIDQFLKAWTFNATVFRQQSGYISAQLHEGVAVCTYGHVLHKMKLINRLDSGKALQ
jgi:hypothetical protein